MSTFRKLSVTCAFCGKASEFNVLTSTNSFGSPDLDLRPAEMQRSTMWLWVQKCPHCSYVSGSIDDSVRVSGEFLSSDEYLSSENLSLPSTLADSFYKQYMIANRCGDYDKAYYALLHCAWACDDCRDKDMSYLVRQKMVDTYCKLSKKMKSNENTVVQYADVLRRSGQFDRVIEEFADFKSNEDILIQIVKFQIELAKNKDDKAYTVRNAINE